MASGHVNRINRPNTWLHRPMLQNVKKALANTEPSIHGTFEACRRTRGMSASPGHFGSPVSTRPGRLLARLRHANEHRECLLSETLRKSCFSAVRAVVDPNRT